jgi:hypothetical protein
LVPVEERVYIQLSGLVHRLNKISQGCIELLWLFVDENVASVLEQDEGFLRHQGGNQFTPGDSVAEDT